MPAHGPAPADAVLIAEPLSIRARRFRQVFVTGLCEGEFPAAQTVSRDPFLGDERRRELALASGLALPPAGDPLDRERYLLYACVSRATERVTFSYRSSDEDGNVVIASPFLEDVAELFGAGWRERRRRRLLADVVWSVDEAPSERERVVASAFADATTRSHGIADGPPGHALALRAGDEPRPPPPDRLRRCTRDVRVLPGEVAGGAPARRQGPRARSRAAHTRLVHPRRAGARVRAARRSPHTADAARRGGVAARGDRWQRRGGKRTRRRPAARGPRRGRARDRGAAAALPAPRGGRRLRLGAASHRVAFGLGGDAEEAVQEGAVPEGAVPEGAILEARMPEEAMPAVALDDGHNRVLLSGVVDRVDADPRDPAPRDRA